MGNTLTINHVVIEDFAFSVMDLDHVMSGYRQLGIKDFYMGVLGADVLESRKAVIDYTGLKLWLK